MTSGQTPASTGPHSEECGEYSQALEAAYSGALQRGRTLKSAES